MRRVRVMTRLQVDDFIESGCEAVVDEGLEFIDLVGARLVGMVRVIVPAPDDVSGYFDALSGIYFEQMIKNAQPMWSKAVIVLPFGRYLAFIIYIG